MPLPEVTFVEYVHYFWGVLGEGRATVLGEGREKEKRYLYFIFFFFNRISFVLN